MAREGLTFRALGHAHPRFNTPDVAILVQGVLAAVMVAVLQDFDKLTTYFVVVEWFALIFRRGGGVRPAAQAARCHPPVQGAPVSAGAAGVRGGHGGRPGHHRLG
jgi:hypothetical protein